MNEQRRSLILKVTEGDLKALELLYPLEKFRIRDYMYMWLIKNKMTGQKFVKFCEEHQFRWGRYGNYIKKKVMREQSILLGKDLISGV